MSFWGGSFICFFVCLITSFITLTYERALRRDICISPILCQSKHFFFYIDNRMKCGDKVLTGQGMEIDLINLL